jgi:hypothetical protein
MSDEPDPDERVRCTSCANYRAGWCHAAIIALLSRRSAKVEIGREFADLLQRCHGYEQVKRRKENA